MSFIRKATDSDIPCLMKVANECFPYSVYWTYENEIAYHFWRFSIQSETSEIWLCESATGVQGFSLNILDEFAWKSSGHIFRISGFRKMILSIKNPKRGYRFIRKSFRNSFRERQALKLSESSHFSLESRLFVDLFAVAPGSRRKGIASALLEKNIERAYQLDRNSVMYNIDKDNFPMLSLMKKHGLVEVSGNLKQVTFARILSW